MFSRKSFSAKSFSPKSWLGLIADVIEETIEVIFRGGSGYNFDGAKLTAKTKRGDFIEIEDEEIIEFLLVFAMWRKTQIFP